MTKNAAAFGFTNTTAACTATISCVTGSFANQNRFLFWDGVHPTAAGHAIIAQYASVLLAPETTAARVAPLGEVAIRARQTAVDDVMDRSSGWARGQFNQQNGVYVNVTGSFANVNDHGGTPAYRSQLGGVRAGLDRAITANTLVGGSVGVSLGEVGGSAIKSNVNSYDADHYATMLNGPVSVTGQAGASLVTFDNSRFVGLGPITALSTTRGLQGNAAVEAGVISKFGGVNVVPSARINYIRANVDGFDEHGDILALSFQSRTVNAFVASAKDNASTSVGIMTEGNAFAELGYERLLTSSGNTINASFVDNTAFPFSTSTGNPLAKGLNAKVGIDGKWGEATNISLSYGVALQDGNGVAHTGQAQIKVPF